MLVAIDATPLTEPAGGIARYTGELTAALAAEFPEDEYWLVSDQQWDAAGTAPRVRVGRLPDTWLRRRWWLAGLPLELRRIGAEVFHGTDFAVPYLGRRPSVMTVHDLSPWAEGDRRTSGAGRVRRRAPLLMRLATMILTPTEAIRRELTQRFGVSPSRVAAVPEAAGKLFRPLATPEPPETPYVLFVGTADRRKNLHRLIEAWREARRVESHLRLVVAGRPRDPRPPEEPGLVYTGLLPDAQVAALMARATVFAYPSLYEGFGLPVLEAMQSGAPVIISRDPALAEVAGDAAVQVDASSTTDLAQAILDVVRHPRRRQELVERGLRRAAEFSWRQTAIRTRAVYQEAIRRKN